ncbi:hypothetical protein RCH09_001431 [Actimicrobium sp. GrIS 1.19]|uniref:hypothetical protein n=1 Tax=Actimicrobium sp. GrIS 1.19 TaxID=3071708 RepID=UPI002DFB287B|nr:hypothetical protein [Actimicrobium sp. GrIS 1.19]
MQSDLPLPLDTCQPAWAAATRQCSTLERMPKWLICVPLAVQWVWLALRYRSATLPSAVNPAITSGGLVGEGKLEYFRGMGALARAATAPHCALPTTHERSDDELQQVLRDAGLTFPLIAKPDLGLCGHGVRRVDDLAGLRSYVAAFPRDEVVVLQTYLAQEGEAGIFYARDPETEQGSLIGLALRYFPRVTGDGIHSIAALIAADPRALRLQAAAQHDCSSVDAARIPAAGEVVRLATIGSTRVGGLYRNGAACITPQLRAAVDAIARDMPQFYAGRFDVRFDSLAALAEGRGFTIIEINGAGAEAIEAWDPQIGLVAGLRMVFAKQRRLFEIGAAQRRRGVRPIGLRALRRLYRRQQQLIALYPPSN